MKGTRIKLGKSWMAHAEDTLGLVCNLDDIVRGQEYVELGGDNKERNKVIITLSRECREWVAGATEAEVRQLIDDHSKPSDPVIYTDGSVTRGVRSGWGYMAIVNGKKVTSGAGAFRSTTSSMRMEIQAVTEALT